MTVQSQPIGWDAKWDVGCDVAPNYPQDSVLKRQEVRVVEGVGFNPPWHRHPLGIRASQDLLGSSSQQATITGINCRWLHAPATNDPIIRPEPPFPMPGPAAAVFGLGEADAPGLSSRK
jgi:hypothetical protein